MSATDFRRLPDTSRLARLATRQEGVVSRRQLIVLGFSQRTISRHVAAGRLHRLYPGVYAVGHARLSERGSSLAAVIACATRSGTSALSHRSAGRLHRFLRSTASGPIDVSSTERHRLAGLRCHQVRRLHPADLTTIGAIPVTTPARTLLDLAEVLHPRRLHDALEQALRIDAFDLLAIRETIERNPGRHGIRPLTETIARLPDVAPTLWSDLEVDLAGLLRASDLPQPSAGVVVEGETVDFLWPGPRVIVETDGHPYHRLAADRLAVTASSRSRATP